MLATPAFKNYTNSVPQRLFLKKDFKKYYIDKTGCRSYIINIINNNRYIKWPGSNIKDFRIKKFSFEM